MRHALINACVLGDVELACSGILNQPVVRMVVRGAVAMNTSRFGELLAVGAKYIVASLSVAVALLSLFVLCRTFKWLLLGMWPWRTCLPLHM